jgi:hypothetical protein
LFLQNVAVSCGTSDADFEKTKSILALNSSLKYICIDVANGYSQFFVDFVKKCRSEWPDKTIMAGNVVTAEMVEELILAGADIIKVGIGPGSVCTTRKKTVWLFVYFTCLLTTRLHPVTGSRLSTAERSSGMCECSPWTGRPHHLRRRLHVSG